MFACACSKPEAGASTSAAASASAAPAKRTGAAGVFDELHEAACAGHVANFVRLFDREELARDRAAFVIEEVEKKGVKIPEEKRKEIVETARRDNNAMFDDWSKDLDRKDRGLICAWKLIDATDTQMNVEMASGGKKLLTVANGKVVAQRSR